MMAKCIVFRRDEDGVYRQVPCDGPDTEYCSEHRVVYELIHQREAERKKDTSGTFDLSLLRMGKAGKNELKLPANRKRA